MHVTLNRLDLEFIEAQETFTWSYFYYSMDSFEISLHLTLSRSWQRLCACGLELESLTI